MVDKKERKNRGIAFSLIIAVAIIVGIMIGFNVIQNMMIGSGNDMEDDTKTYQEHIAMIVRDPSDMFWQSVYSSAYTSGLELGIYIENFGAELSEGYTVVELMEMAIAADVDGIILESDAGDEVAELINEASGKDIPVITMGTDVQNSERKSFVSANAYTLGEMYANQILELLDGTEQKITVLISSDNEQSQSNLINSGIKYVINKSYSNAEFSTIVTNASDEFAVEENIRNLLISSNKRPDIIVCLSPVDTISAYQCVVDFNLVGSVEIVGSYTSPEILDGITKGIIHSSIAVDTKEMGEVVSKGMFDYLISEYVSDYMSVDANLINASNVDEYKEGEE
ncbi:MAG: substrate-binding domain-containing protein [Suipraeoptans sp.]